MTPNLWKEPYGSLLYTDYKHLPQTNPKSTLYQSPTKFFT